MAKSDAVWGIEIGQCALKALRCRPHEKDPNRVIVEAFDYIEYPKILTQPEADRESLVREALAQFVSRNATAGDRVAISVPGQSGLARFIKLPPVEAKKIPDIVRYEARQQIPFALDDVVWDYQPLRGGSQEEGYAIETEVGLFAMKRDQVARALKPLEEAGIDVDIIQLAPLAIYNFVCFDRLGSLEAADPAKPPPSKVVISLGTDTTDLVITNGFRVWQRSIPIGGNHFTKALTKELKLTFAKAEHLKRNATKAENPKLVFQAMRPVFSDLVAEIQRSLGFFTSNNRDAQLGEIIAMGSPMKLPGLQRYLSQNLDQNVDLVDQFTNLVGGSATAAPQFKENQLTFPVAYGLCVQALGRSLIKTNLLPEEIVTTRLVRAKKPWAVAAAALLLVSIAINYVSHYSAWRSADVSNPAMASALQASQGWSQEAQALSGRFSELTGKFNEISEIGHNLQSNIDGRLLWLELLKAIDATLPRDERPPEARKETAEDISHREELHITSMDCQYFDDVSVWFAGVKPWYDEAQKSAVSPAAGENAGVDDAAADAGAAPDDAYADGTSPDGVSPDGMDSTAENGLTGPGWVIQLKGHHFHNGDDMRQNEGLRFIQNTFFKNLKEGTVALPDGPNGELIDVPIVDLGISHAVVVTENPIDDVTYLKEPVDESGGGQQRQGIRDFAPDVGDGTGKDSASKTLRLREYDFTIQFCWRPQPRDQRREKQAQQGGVVPGTAATQDEPSPATNHTT
jgi:type IV pilus assembly protein PilM